MPRSGTEPRPTLRRAPIRDETARIRGLARAIDAWASCRGACEALNVRPSLPGAWRATDPTLGVAWNEREGREDLRIVETMRRRALEGDAASLRDCFRSIKGPARALDRTTAAPELDGPSPEVAAAMLEAGLAALGEPAVDVPAPALKTQDPGPAPPALPPRPRSSTRSSR